MESFRVCYVEDEVRRRQWIIEILASINKNIEYTEYKSPVDFYKAFERKLIEPPTILITDLFFDKSSYAAREVWLLIYKFLPAIFSHIIKPLASTTKTQILVISKFSIYPPFQRTNFSKGEYKGFANGLQLLMDKTNLSFVDLIDKLKEEKLSPEDLINSILNKMGINNDNIFSKFDKSAKGNDLQNFKKRIEGIYNETND